MTMAIPDRIAARIRTAWPMLLGYLAARLLDVGAPVADWLTATLGITVTEAHVVAGLGLLLGYGIYEAGGWLESRTGTSRPAAAARAIGRFLLALGLPIGPPTYPPTGRPAPLVPYWARRP